MFSQPQQNAPSGLRVPSRMSGENVFGYLAALVGQPWTCRHGQYGPLCSVADRLLLNLASKRGRVKCLHWI
jgi:hypothetical protein